MDVLYIKHKHTQSQTILDSQFYKKEEQKNKTQDQAKNLIK